MSSLPMNDEQIATLIRDALTSGIEQIISEEADAAAERVRKRIQDKRAEVATRIVSHFNMDMQRGEIHITVKNIDKVDL